MIFSYTRPFNHHCGVFLMIAPSDSPFSLYLHPFISTCSEITCKTSTFFYLVSKCKCSKIPMSNSSPATPFQFTANTQLCQNESTGRLVVGFYLKPRILYMHPQTGFHLSFASFFQKSGWCCNSGLFPQVRRVGDTFSMPQQWHGFVGHLVVLRARGIWAPRWHKSLVQVPTCLGSKQFSQQSWFCALQSSNTFCVLPLNDS